ncbi:hypothetical protein [Vineibacter terrae]|uniref:helix-turn-helix transcriptional regulator n=1 Tax=Vineibacter terrae TaxID=2586908 RepID=UPI002E373AAA|nr:hypothetical protein [Vineibacter terrae]HEX2888928.1 hypothetical protein [Vineibacter terrae]
MTRIAFDLIRKTYGAILERLDVGVVLLDVAGRPSFINARAARIVARGDGLRADQNGVAASFLADSRTLHAAIATAGGAADTEARRVYLSRPSGLASLVVTILPLGRLAEDGRPDAPCTALFIVDPEAPLRIDTQGLGTAYGLTPREASIAALLSRGADLTQAASTLGIGTSSAREYLKRALDKTGTRRQANLVRLVLRSFAVSHA